MDAARFSRIWEIEPARRARARGARRRRRRSSAATARSRVRRIERAGASRQLRLPGALDRRARQPRRRAAAPPPLPLAGRSLPVPEHRLQLRAPPDWSRSTRTLRRALLAQPVDGATRRHRVPGRACSAARSRSRPACPMSGCARRRKGPVDLTVAIDGQPALRVTTSNESGWLISHVDTRGARGPDRRRALRDQLARALRAPLRLRRRGAHVERASASRRRSATALIALRAAASPTVRLAAGGREERRLRPRRGPVHARRRALLGLVRGAGRQPQAPRRRALVHARRASIATGATTRPIIRCHEDAVRPVVARVPSLHLHGPDARAAPASRSRAAHHAAAVRARIDRLSIPRHPVRGAADRDGLSSSRAGSCRGRRQPRAPCWRSPSRTTSSTRPSPASTRRSPPWRSPSASPTGSRCAARAGGSPAASIFGVALGTKHNAWLMPIFLAGALPVDEARTTSCAGVALPRVPLAFLIMAVLGPADLLAALAVALAGAAARARSFISTGICSTSTTTSNSWDRTGTTHRPTGAQAAARDVPFRVDRPDGARDHAGAGDLGWRRAVAPPPGDARASRASTTGGAARLGAARAGCVRAPTSIARRAHSSPCRSSGRSACWRVPSTPIFGGVKHFMPAMPFLAVAAAIGVAALTRVAGGRLRRCARRGSLRALPVGASGAGLPARRRRNAPLAARRAQPLQPARGRLRRRRFAGNEPPVLGILRAAHAGLGQPRTTPTTGACTGTTCIGDALHMYKRDGRLDLARRRHRRRRGRHPGVDHGPAGLGEALGHLRGLVLGQLRHGQAGPTCATAKECRWSSVYKRGVR